MPKEGASQQRIKFAVIRRMQHGFPASRSSAWLHLAECRAGQRMLRPERKPRLSSERPDISNNCGIILDFNANGTKYKLRMGPGCPSCVGIPAPTTFGLLTVTCNSVSNGQCTNWTFVPNMTPSSTNPPTVANLYYYAKGGKLTFFGQYYMTFRFASTGPRLRTSRLLRIGERDHYRGVVGWLFLRPRSPIDLAVFQSSCQRWG